VLDQLIGVLAEKPDVAVVGCTLEGESGSIDHAAKRSFPTPLSALGHFTGLRRLGGPLADYTAVDRGCVDVTGAFILVRRRALEEGGLFDEGYWMYMEVLELSYCLVCASWRTWYEPSVAVSHVKAGTSG
jgi:N-acetylglucosaminyl-diphospho-decaprenol L-rhamnosyltransferase